MKRTELSFEKGAILRKEMLQDLYQYPKAVMNTYFDSYGDGILYGLSWKENGQGTHAIMPGALKFQGQIYVQEEPLCVEEYFGNQQGCTIDLDQKYRIFFLNGRPAKEEPSRKIFTLEPVLIQSGELEEAERNGFYYAYVRMDGGHGMRLIADSDCLYGLHAGNGMYGFRLPPQDLKERILPVLEKKKHRHILDYELLKGIYTEESVQTEIVVLYIQEYFDMAGSSRSVQADRPKQLLEQLAEAAENLEYQLPALKSSKKQQRQEKSDGLKIRLQGTL